MTVGALRPHFCEALFDGHVTELDLDREPQVGGGVLVRAVHRGLRGHCSEPEQRVVHLLGGPLEDPPAAAGE